MKEGVSTERKKCEYLSLCLSAPLFLPHGNAIVNCWNTPLTGHFFYLNLLFPSRPYMTDDGVFYDLPNLNFS